ncbi:hypothetical protein GYMLUDRAFT_528840 [Collybiopsis luxurians FD-317 M1]|nr:hypothetical protein GYMLUDRAFT_528840 [Collybiopsis luxurians FD-317 M1]
MYFLGHEGFEEVKFGETLWCIIGFLVCYLFSLCSMTIIYRSSRHPPPSRPSVLTPLENSTSTILNSISTSPTTNEEHEDDNEAGLVQRFNRQGFGEDILAYDEDDMNGDVVEWNLDDDNQYETYQ